MRNTIFTKGSEHVAAFAREMKPSMKARGRLLVGAVALVVLAACDPVPVGDTSCKSALGCEIVELTAKEARRDIGKNFGGGVVLRNARALGQTLVMDVSLPLTSKAFAEPSGQSLIAIFGKSFAKGFCDGQYAREFFKMGSTVRLRGFSKDGKLVADQVVRSCGGRKR